MNRIIEYLKLMKMAGLEVVKANSEQIAFNRKDGTMPLVCMNDMDYRTPQPHIWAEIEDEIKRLKKEQEK